MHTPGPWRVGDAGATVFGPPNSNPSPETVATVRKRDNATLIAAAPELFAALQDAISALQAGTAEDAAAVLVRRGIPAIAKAEGR